MLMLDEKFSKVIRIHPHGTMNICTKFLGNPSNNCQDMSLEVKNVNINSDPMKRGHLITKVSRANPLESMIICMKFHYNSCCSC